MIRLSAVTPPVCGGGAWRRRQPHTSPHGADAAVRGDAISTQHGADLQAPTRAAQYGKVTRDRGDTRTVYSTAAGRVCSGCGWPEAGCTCSRRAAADEPVPARIVAKLRMEKAGRGGKTVTVVYGLPRNAAFLKDLLKDLKRACGTGGTVGESSVELQGDLRERVRQRLQEKGFVLKGH